jgi:cysteine-S-conjugate beta-lyase
MAVACHDRPMTLRDLSDRELRDRAGAKWTAAGPGVLPAWVAEMDFALAEPVAAALHDAVDRGAVGYSPADARTGVARALAVFTAERWAWAPEPAHVVLVPDVMVGIELVLRTLCEDAAVVVPTPAYPPFLDVVPLTGRALVPVPLDPDGPAALDLRRIDAALAAGARTVLLCQPHNPWGRVFGREELEGLRDVVLRHGARVISDEVHAPLVLPGAAHLPYGALEGTAAHTTTVLSAAKAWNVPGLRCAQVVTGGLDDADALRALPHTANHGPSPLGVVGALAAYRHGTPWLEEVLQRLDANRTLFGNLVAELLPGVRQRPLEATYLAWLDVRALGHQDPAGLALREGRVMVNDGARFGPGGQGHVRVNLATSPERVERIARRLATAWRRRPGR